MKIVKKSKKVIKNQINNVSSLLNIENILGLCLTLFIVLDLQPSMKLASFFSSASGYFVLFILFLYVTIALNPIVSIIYVIFVYELVRRSNIKIQSNYLKFIPGESTRSKYMKKNKFFPNTLEEDIISERVPKVKYNEDNFFEFKDSIDSGISYSTF